MQKGQYIRLLLATTATPTKVIAAAKEMRLHFSAQTEESSTKDTTGSALEFEVTGQSYDITGSALVITDDDTLNTGANSVDDMLSQLSDTPLYWRIAVVSGTNNRTVGTVIASGQCKLTQLTLQGPNRQNATYSYTLNGYGDITVGS